MALTVTAAGSGTSTTNNNTLSTGATITAAVGDWLFAIIGRSGSTVSSVTDSAGNTWHAERANIDGVVDLALWTCQVTNALSSGSVTVTFAAAITEKAIRVWRLEPGSGEAVSLVSVDTTGATGSRTTHSAPTVNVANGDTVFGCGAIETDDVLTGDSDTTNGSWTALDSILADGGGDGFTVTASSQQKVVTATGNQDWAITTAVARNSSCTTIVFRSAAAAAGRPFAHLLPLSIAALAVKTGAMVPALFYSILGLASRRTDRRDPLPTSPTPRKNPPERHLPAPRRRLVERGRDATLADIRVSSAPQRPTRRLGWSP